MNCKTIFTAAGPAAVLLLTAAMIVRAAEAPDACALYRAGAERYEQGDYAGAVETFAQAVAAEPANAEFQRMAGLAWRRLGDKTRALEHLRKAVELDPNGIPGQYARHTVSMIEANANELSLQEAGPAYFPGHHNPSDGERYYRPRIEALPTLAGTSMERKVKELKSRLLAGRFRMAAAPDELEMHRASLNELRTALTPVQFIESEVERIKTFVIDWAETVLTLMKLYAEEGHAKAAADAFAMLRDSPFMQRGKPEIIAELPAFKEAIKQYGVKQTSNNANNYASEGKRKDKKRTMKLVEVRRIWDKAPHNAFTDLIRFHDRWFCVFREGQGHVSPDGALRVITSLNGEEWESAALIVSTNADLRDAKITITPNGQLMLCGGASLHDQSKNKLLSFAWFSDDGRTWSEKHLIGDPDLWLWRVTWHKGKAYSIGYGCGNDQFVRLYSSDDGKKFDTLVERLFDVGDPNETSLVFEGDTLYCLLRRDGNPNTGMLGVSQPPYTAWEWKDLGKRIGGPHMLRLPDGRFVAAVRLYDGRERTSLCWLDIQSGTLTEALTLPSGGDTSYAGLVLHEGLLWVSYYSTHEEKTAIYLAKVKVEEVECGWGNQR